MLRNTLYGIILVLAGIGAWECVKYGVKLYDKAHAPPKSTSNHFMRSEVDQHLNTPLGKRKL